MIKVMGLKRIVYDQLLKWRASPDRKPLILQGARQVGKTYLLKEFGHLEFTKYHYVNFEKDRKVHIVFEKDLEPTTLLAELGLHLGVPIDEKNDLIVFDEIQECPRALTSLKYFNEEKPHLAICAAGSLLGLSLSPESFPVGKVKFLKIYPLSFSEVLLASGEEVLLERWRNASLKEPISETAHQKLWEIFKNYLIVGGLPSAVLTYLEHFAEPLQAYSLVREKQDDLLTTHIADMAKHAGKTNSMHLERLWRDVPAQLARALDGSARRFQFKNVIPGKNKYSQLTNVIDWLQKAGLVLKIPIVNQARFPFLAFSKESFFKLYCFDVGMLGALSGLPPKTILDYDYGTYKGFVAENFVAQELICSGYGSISAWNEGTAEVEFLFEKDGEIFVTEVKSGWVTRSKSLKVFATKYPLAHAITLSGKLHAPIYMAGRVAQFIKCAKFCA